MKKLIVFAIAIFGFTAVSFAQSATSTASASSSATIITPISIALKSGTTGLNFGNIVANTTQGTVTVTPAGGRSASGLTLPTATPGTISAAEFTVTGLADATYSITLPGTFNVNGPSSATMAVGTFISNPASTGVLTSGTQDLKVGATLTVGANQAAGPYTNLTGLTVTVNYN